LDVIFNGAALTNVEGGTVANVEVVTANLGGGNDTVHYGATTASVTVHLGTGTASGFTSITNIENVTAGVGNDTLTGSTGAAILNTLNGGAGNDTYIVDGGETVTEAAGGGTDTVLSSAATFTLGANVENLTLTGTGNSNGTGNGTANVLTGNVGDNVLSGAAGNDTLIGDAGDDTLIGGTGNDTLNGGAGNDILNGGAGTDVFVFDAPAFDSTINGFDANAVGGQDLLDISARGITATTFATAVNITAEGTGTMIDFGDPAVAQFHLVGVNAAAISATDFILAS
jgi:Ca2+-binding RTX toxin-like protein